MIRKGSSYLREKTREKGLRRPAAYGREYNLIKTEQAGPLSMIRE